VLRVDLGRLLDAEAICGVRLDVWIEGDEDLWVRVCEIRVRLNLWKRLMILMW
jgi:hypothetical protein